MAKYSFDFKRKVVQEYLNGDGSYGYLAEKFDIPSSTPIKEWVKTFRNYGDEGLLRSRQNKKYTFEKKLHVVELYLSTEVSYQELAIIEGITTPAMIANWVQRFRIAGPDSLRPRKKGRKKTLNKSKKNITSQHKDEAVVDKTSIDTSAEYVMDLEDELLKLRIENAFLKELMRLHLEDEAKMRERQKSSAASEDSLN